MNDQRKTLLVGLAALALVAGTGLAQAQETPRDQGPQNKQPHATQQMNQAPTGGKMGQGMGQGMQEQNRGPAAQQPGQRAQENNRANKGETSATEEQRKARPAEPDKAQNVPGEHNGAAAQQENANRNNTAAQREHNGMEGLQGNASGMHAKLTDEQRTRIRDTVIRASGAPRVGRVDFDVTVGTVVPRDRLRIIPVPETLVQIEPEWRGFMYFVYEDQVVVVDPNDMRIVAVVPA
jgi:hypothetical protein